jgi:hypothetical protein
MSSTIPTIPTDSYAMQRALWPESGQHILACYDEKTIVVYQAYSPAIGNAAAASGRFGAGWSRTRMSWIKPNFLWMMYRCGWAEKPDQEVVLAIRLIREGFEQILARAEYSAFSPQRYASRAAWERAVAESSVRLQWDPDHDPHGNKLARRAIQLGLRGPSLAQFADEWIESITDITDFVRAQRAQRDNFVALQLPRERVYRPRDPEVAARLGL